MKRVAICVSGHVRTMFHALPISLETIKRENPGLEFDFYAAVWDKEAGRVPHKINDPHHYTADIDIKPEMLNGSHIGDWLVSLGGGSSIVKMLDSSKMADHLRDGHAIIGAVDHHLMPQYYSTRECFRLVDTSKYTHVVRLRPDIVINSFPRLEHVNFDLVTNTDMWYASPACIGFENEMVWIASAMFAMESASLYDRLVDGSYLRGPTHGEAMTGRHFSAMNCSKARYNFDYRVAR